MDSEFHYNINYIIALAAGADKADAYKLAYSSQFVDDNTQSFLIEGKRTAEKYNNSISQTYNVFLDSNFWKRIYLSHHFIPGDDDTNLITTPNSKIANQLLSFALKAQDPFLIGIASHAYADTWAHQNFAGIVSDENALAQFPYVLIPNIGHADFFEKPDMVNCIWYDRLKRRIFNNNRFIQAIKALYTAYVNSEIPIFRSPLLSMKDLSHALKSIMKVEQKAARYQLYIELIYKISGHNLPSYHKKDWQEDIMYHEYGRYRWKCSNFKQQNWFLFQEAIKTYQEYAWKIIYERLERAHDRT